jgi:hypothetical protein
MSCTMLDLPHTVPGMTESELPSCLPSGLQKLAHDILGSGVLLIQDLLWRSQVSQLSECLSGWGVIGVG